MSDSASLAPVPLGLLKWLQFNVQKEDRGFYGGGRVGGRCDMHF